MSAELREELENYIRENFTEEMADEYMATLMVFDAFENQKAFDIFPDILYDYDSQDNDVTREKIIAAFDEEIGRMFKAHRIEVPSDVPLEVRNQMLSVLYRLQSVEDPTPTLRILETDLSNEEMLAKVISDFSMLDESTVLMAVESIDDAMVTGLRNHLYAIEENNTKEQDAESSTESQRLLFRNLKDFFEVHGRENIGYLMIENGVHPGHRSGLYYPHFKDDLVTDSVSQTAKNLLSFFFLSSDLFNDPLAVYRKVSDKLIPSVDMITKVEVELSNQLNALRQYQKAKDDARRVSVVQHQA